MKTTGIQGALGAPVNNGNARLEYRLALQSTDSGFERSHFKRKRFNWGSDLMPLPQTIYETPFSVRSEAALMPHSVRLAL